MTIIRLRLNDFHQLPFRQADVDFAIPFLDEDLPLFLDPFLLWKSPALQDQSFHTVVTNAFNELGHRFLSGKEDEAISTLVEISECNEVGLGHSGTRVGKRIGQKLARQILSLFSQIPQVREAGFTHFEEIQLLVDSFSTDRVSDVACSFIKSYLIDYTIQNCMELEIPCEPIELSLYDYQSYRLTTEVVEVPLNPLTQRPLLLVPLRWLRRGPWINFSDFRNDFLPNLDDEETRPKTRARLLEFNRHNYDLVERYVAAKETAKQDCSNDPLFTPIPVHSRKRKLQRILRLPSGTTNNAHRKYEDTVCQLLASLVYPDLDFADEQSRTDSGVHIRDLIFYNNKSIGFLEEIWDTYESRQIVFELKNVAEVQNTHVNQLNRYLAANFGRFGVLVTRNRLPKKVFKNTIDLWSGQRKCIIAVTDADLEMMVEVSASGQRSPVEVLKKKYVEFVRACPS